MFIAALGPAMLELAGEIADGVLLNWTAAGRLAESVERVREGAAKAGRDPSEIAIAGYVRVAVGEDVAPARASLQRQIAVYAGMSYYRSFFDNAGFQEEMAAVDAALERGDRQAAYEAITPEMQDQVAVVGTAEHCRAELKRPQVPGTGNTGGGALSRGPRVWVVPGNAGGYGGGLMWLAESPSP